MGRAQRRNRAHDHRLWRKFTAADISVTYALELAQRAGGVVLGDAEQAYVARTSARDAYQRAMQTCHATRACAAEAARR